MGTASGPLRKRFLWQVAIIGLVLRLCLLPLGHPWDTTTFYNMFIDLGHGRSPYDTMRYLNWIGLASKWGVEGAYQGYAYPPGAIYLYWPLAHIFTWLHPGLTNHFTVEGLFSLPRFPLDFFLWLKLPFWLGDLGIAALLWRMTGSVRSFRDYLLNPYVLLISGCWTFDSVMVFCLLLAAYWLQRGRLGWSGVALAVGTILKFIPGFIAPVFALYLIQRNRTVRELAIFLGAFIASCIGLVLPYLGGTLYAIQFQGSRPGVGLDWEELLVYGGIFSARVNWLAVNFTLSNYALGLFVVGMLLTYRYIFLHEMPLNRMVLITLLVYFLTSKVVNEQYFVALVPFSLVELHGVRGRRPAWRSWRPIHMFLWVTPLTFAAFNVPLDRFLLPLYATVLGPRASVLINDGITGVQDQLQIIPWYHYTLHFYFLLAIAYWFVAIALVALIMVARRHSSVQASGAAAALGQYISGAVEYVLFAWSSLMRASQSIIIGGRPAPKRKRTRRAVAALAPHDSRPRGKSIAAAAPIEAPAEGVEAT